MTGELAWRLEIREPEQLAGVGAAPGAGSTENVPPTHTKMFWKTVTGGSVLAVTPPLRISLYPCPAGAVSVKAYCKLTVPAPGAEKGKLGPGPKAIKAEPGPLPASVKLAKFAGTAAPPVGVAAVRKLETVLPSPKVQGTDPTGLIAHGAAVPIPDATAKSKLNVSHCALEQCTVDFINLKASASFRT